MFEILELVERERLLEREQYWMDALDSANPRTGFNVSPTAGSPLGVKHSAEARAKQSAARKGKKKPPLTAEARAKISATRKRLYRETMIERNKSKEMREKVRAAKIKLYSDPVRLAELSAMSRKMWAARRASGLPLGRPHTEATKLRLSIAKKGKMSLEHKAAIAESNRRRAVSAPNRGTEAGDP